MTAAAFAARRLLRSQHAAALATLSKRLEGYPFASAVDFITDREARPVFFISALAEHARNIEHDPRVSLLAQENGSEAQASPRLILVGDARRVPETETAALKNRYLRYFPDTRQYFELDFMFWQIEPRQLRFIPGFAQARWLSPGDFQPPPGQLAGQEEALIERLNQTLAGRLPEICRRHRNIETAEATVLGVDCDGFDLRANGRILRFDFDQPLLDAAAAEQAIASMAR